MILVTLLVLTILGVALSEGYATSILASRPLIWLGEISYSISIFPSCWSRAGVGARRFRGMGPSRYVVGVCRNHSTGYWLGGRAVLSGGTADALWSARSLRQIRAGVKL